MRLLEPLTLPTRILARAARGGAGLVVHVTKGVVGRAWPSDPQAPARDAAPPQRTEPSAAPAAPPPAPLEAPAPPAPPAPFKPLEALESFEAFEPLEATEPDQPEFAPPHIAEEVAEVVYSSSDAGAEDGAGPSIHVDEPWDGYRAMAAADVIDRLAVADTAMLAAIQLYETSHKQRPSILKAVELRLEAAARA